MIVQAVVGFIAVEYLFSITKRFRQKDLDIDPRLKIFERSDTGRWARWKFYPVAMLTMMTRILLFFLILFLGVVTLHIMMIGHDFRNGPIKNCFRRTIVRGTLKFMAYAVLLLIGVRYNINYRTDVDYSYYLGPDYDKERKNKKDAPTWICNHQNIIDVIMLGS